jgi:hypothetical protein
MGAMVLAGCASNPTPWAKDGVPATDFDAVSQQCKTKAESQMQTMQQQVVISYVNCLESQGWRPVKK